jgi:hypothetical protein
MERKKYLRHLFLSAQSAVPWVKTIRAISGSLGKDYPRNQRFLVISPFDQWLLNQCCPVGASPPRLSTVSCDKGPL